LGINGSGRTVVIIFEPAYRAIASGKVTMKKAGVVSFGILFALFVFIAAGSNGGEKKTFILKEDLAIGVESGDENLMFGSVADIGLDAAGNIFVLDWNSRRVQVFDSQGKFLRSIVGKQGQGPEEVAELGGVAVSPSGIIAVLDRGGSKVILFNKEGVFLRLFKLTFPATYLGCLEGDRVVVLGLNEGKVFHVFDPGGHPLASFGGPFDVPSHLSQFKEIPQLKYPLRFSCSPEGDIFVFDPHKFEISVYKDFRLAMKLTGKSDLFEPVRIAHSSSERVGMVFPFLSVLKHGERLYVTVMRPPTKGEGPNELIVYENDKPVGSLPVAGMPRAIDSQGRIYCADEDDYPRLVRYVVK
jgi:hypothetical protein